jgi:hypothetical protein
VDDFQTYTCTCKQGWSGNECDTNEFANTQISITPTTIVTSSLTTSSQNEEIVIMNDGTSPLFISSMESNVPWATIFQGTPGNQPDLSVAIAGGTETTFGIQFQGGSTPICDEGECLFVGNITVRSNAPLTPQLGIGLEFTVSQPNLAVIAIPQQLSTTLYPQGSLSYNMLVYNVMVDPILWSIPRCTCVCHGGEATEACPAQIDLLTQLDGEEWLNTPGNRRSCTIDSKPWLQFDACGGYLGVQDNSIGLVATFAAVESVWAVGVYSATIDVSVPAQNARWPVTATLQVVTDAQFFSGNTSFYDFRATSDQNLIPGASFTVSVEPRDLWGNTISEPLVQPEALRFQVVDPLEDRVLSSFGMDYDYVTQLQVGEGTVERNGTFLLVVSTLAGVGIKPRLAFENGIEEWLNVNTSGLRVESRPCDPPRTFPSRNGNACLYAFCDPGKEVQNRPDEGICAPCERGKFSDEGVKCKPCPYMTYCAVTGCTVCSACEPGLQPFAPDSSTCVDFDECASTQLTNGNCDKITECINTVGSRECGACPPGYTGTGDLGPDGAGEGCAMPEIPAGVDTSKTSKMQLSTKVAFRASPDVRVEGSLAREQYIAGLVRTLAASMGVNESEIAVKGLRTAGQRRRTQAIGDLTVELDFSIVSQNPAAALLSLSADMANSSSPLMTTVQMVEGQTIVPNYACPDFMVRVEGASVCTACQQGEEPITLDCGSTDCPGFCSPCTSGKASQEGRVCESCAPGKMPSENLALCIDCQPTEYSESGKECKTCPPVSTLIH